VIVRQRGDNPCGWVAGRNLVALACAVRRVLPVASAVPQVRRSPVLAVVDQSSRSGLRSLDSGRARIVVAVPWVIRFGAVAAFDIGLVTLVEWGRGLRGLGGRCPGSGHLRFWIMVRRINPGGRCP
jgi:hypothetical protein